MRFPYQKNLGSTLRDFAGVQRHQSYARTLGLSSITKGEGSIDLLPSDTSTTPEASIGDLPDGSQGVGARIGGTMVNLATWSKGQVDALGGRLDSHASRIGAAENRLDSQQSTLNSHTTTLASHSATLTNHSSRLDSHASRIGAAENRLDSHASRIGAVENKVNNQVTQSQIDEIIQRLKTLYGYLGIAWDTIGA